MKHILLIGASSTIAQATLAELQNTTQEVALYCVTSKKDVSFSTGISSYVCDYSEGSIKQLAQHFSAQQIYFDQVLIFNGQLHCNDYFPEKKITAFEEHYLYELMSSNVLPHIYWYGQLQALLRKQGDTRVLVLSARIGSISDNRSGGWYSYRMTKAMLNMATKTFSIELMRTHPKAKVLLFHPGTTDTPLSKPFQKNVPKEKLFEPMFVGARIVDALNTEYADNQIEFIDWQNKPIAW